MLLKSLHFALLVVIAFVLLSYPLSAQGNSQGKGHNKHAQDQSQDDNAGPDGGRGGVRIVFSTRDREVIRGYYYDRR